MNTVFEGFGCVIVEREGQLFIQYDSGESFGSRVIENKISRSEANKAMKREKDAYEVILQAQAKEALKK